MTISPDRQKGPVHDNSQIAFQLQSARELFPLTTHPCDPVRINGLMIRQRPFIVC